MNLPEISQRIKDAHDSPHMLAAFRVELSAEFTARSEQMKRILREKAKAWPLMRENHKSDTSCERAWAATELGIQETDLRYDMKALEKTSSAIKGMLDVMQSEARNLM